MAFDYEGAKAGGYSDAEIADYLSQKHKYDISGARNEGYSDSEIIQHLIGKGGDSFYQRNVPEPIKNAIGGIESVARMPWNAVAGTIAKGLGTVTGLATGEDMGLALQRGEEAAHRVSIDPFTKQGKVADEALGEAYEKLYRETAGDIGSRDIRYDPNAPTGSPRADPRNEAKARSLYEAGADALGFAGLFRGRRPRETPPPAPDTPIPEARQPLHPMDQMELFEPQAPQYGRGQARVPEDMYGQRELFPDTPGQRFVTPDEAAIDAQSPRSPYSVQETPRELRGMNRASAQLEDPSRPFYGHQETGLAREIAPQNWDLSRGPQRGEPLEPPARGKVPYEPEHPTMGLEGTTTRGASPEPGRQIPGVNFERADLGREYPSARVQELAASDKVLKGLNTKITNSTNLLDRLKAQAGEVLQRQAVAAEQFKAYHGENIKGDLHYPQALSKMRAAEKEYKAFERAIKAQEREVAKLQKQVDTRMSSIEKRAMNERPTIQKVFTPPRGQRGAVNPEVFREGFEKVKTLAGQGIQFVARNVRNAWQGDGVLEIQALSPNGKQLGEVIFRPTQKGLQEINTNLYSESTHVHPLARRHGIAAEMYKFAQELGNDIVPSKTLLSDGRKMWEGFEAKGLTKPGRTMLPRKMSGQLNMEGFLGKKITDRLSGLLDKKEPGPQKPVDKSAILKAAEGETRTKDQAKKDIGPLEDLPDGIWEKTMEWFSNAQNVYNNTRNPWVRYIADFAANTKQQAILSHDLMTRGISLGKGIWLKKVIDPNSPAGIWFKSFTPSERKQAADVINKYSGVEFPTPDQMRALGASERVIQKLGDLQKPLHEMWESINKERSNNGLKPMPFRPFYFMKASGFGNWMVRVKDAEGNTLAFHRMPMRWQADRLGSQLSERFKKDNPDLKIEIDEANRATRGNKYNVNTTLFEEVMGALEKNDPRRAAINSAIADIKSKGGFGSHSAFRKGVEGMEITPDNFWKTYDSYLKDGANYVANLKLSKMVKDLDVDKDIPPRLRQWSQDHLNLARGAHDPGSLVKAVESGADNFLKALSGGQLASGSARQGVLTSGKMFLTQALLFWQHPFLAGQILQSTGFMPYALANWKYNLGYGKGSAVESMLKGSMNLMFDPKKYKSTIDYLGYRGKLDPSLVAEIGWKSDTGLGKAWEVVSGGYIAKGAEALGRIHAAAVGHEFMSAQGLKGKDLHMAVERFVDDVMGNYGMTDRPGYITRTGVVGEALKPLSTFKNYFLGATAVALKEGLTGIKAGNPKKMIPFINLWMGTAVLGGLTGALGYAELDWAYNKLKGYKWFQEGMKEAFGVTINENSPSLTEAVLTSDIGDTASLGIVTGASKLFDEKGIYLSGSMTAPEVTPSIVTHGVLSGLAPGVGYAVDAVGGLTKIIMDQLDFAPMTVEERRKANKQLAPGIIDKILNNIDGNLRVEDTISRMFSEDKDLFIRDRPTPEGVRGHGGYDRRTNYDIYASIAGGGTIPEYKEKVARRDLKETEAAAAAQKTRLIDMGVDDIMFGDGSRIGELATKAIELGFDDYTDQIMDQLMKKYLTNKQAEAMKEPNLRTIRRQQYLDEASQ